MMLWICFALGIAGIICILILVAGSAMEERMDDDHLEDDEETGP